MFEKVIRYRLVIVLAWAGATLFLALQLPGLRLEPDTEAYVPDDHPVRTFWQQAEDDFGLGRNILVALEADGERGVFTPGIIGAIARLTDRLQALPSVEEGAVTSISTVDVIEGTEAGLEVEPLFEQAPSTQAEVDRLRERVFRNPVLLDRLVSRDGAVAMILVKSFHGHGTDPLEVWEQVEEILADTRIPGARLLPAGTVVIEHTYGRQMSQDLARLVPLALLAVLVVLFFCFRTISMPRLALRITMGCVLVGTWQWVQQGQFDPLPLLLIGVALAMLTVRGVLLPLLVVAVSVTWAFGVQAMFDLPIYIAGTMVPPLLMAIGCADGIHILDRYVHHSSDGGENKSIVVRTMKEMWRPVVLTSVTTAAGFGGLIAGNMTVYRVFGFSVALGVLVAMACSLTLLPALLSWLRLPSTSVSRSNEVLLPRTLGRLGGWLETHRLGVVRGFVVVVLLGVAGASTLRIDYSWVESLKEGTPVLEAERILRKRHGGTVPLHLLVDSGVDGGVKEPEVMLAIDTVLTRLAEKEYVGDTRSLVEYVKRMNQAMNEDRPGELRVPDTRELIAQYLLLYTMSASPDEFDEMVDYNYRRANATVLLRTDSLAVIHDVHREAEALLDEHVRPLVEQANVTGSASMLKIVMDNVFYSQVWSVSVAGVLIFLAMAVLFRSVADAIICMMPSTFTAVVNFGVMGAAGVPLGPEKAMITAIALGIGIDYSIHLMSRFRALVARAADVRAATIEAMHSTGRAIVFNGAVVVMGFMVLAFSSSPSNAEFGRLIAANMALSCLGALTVLPAALAMHWHREKRREAAGYPEDSVATESLVEAERGHAA
ncbi:MAG: MMPL family transporter [Proteobacteria bacterium]|nr:MMPL family transporter [Pseudomonadota bacterium]